jgi:hypothetical protein
MTAAKIAITIHPEQLALARAAVRSGRAESVSAYIARALEQHAREESLADLARDLIAIHGKPTPEETAWAKRVLKPKRHKPA